jgi:16S rRNA processing protein RimM
MPEPKDSICVGAITGAFGVKGEARIKSFCAEPRDIEQYAPLITEDGRSFDLKITRPVKEGFAVRLSGELTREDTEALKGMRLYASRDQLPQLPDDEYYHADLIGLLVVDTGGEELGRVRAVHDFGAGDVLDIVGGKKPIMLPFTLNAVPTVDLTAGRIIADLEELGDE